ncbi:DUF2931 family protein [Hymenobacter ruricola]|uniref:DUF2931 family protein n=1 Tax=Hymenobacter ruricola TaxID=2791023 RepID=UPI0021D0D0DE|nr:DUF2931 family protein [Hymenobacter ruricola]
MSQLAGYLLALSLAVAAWVACSPTPLILKSPGSVLPATTPPPPESFRLSAAPAAAEGYPMEVIDGYFLPAAGNGSTGIPIAPEFLEGDWGHSAISWGVGNPIQPVPERFWVRWYSYPEDKFYEGHWLLPGQHLTELLRQGYWNTKDKQHETYDGLTLCLLPKGVVVVWLTGANQVLLGRYEGSEINYDFKRFNEAANRPRMVVQEQAKLPPAVQHEIKTHTLSTRRWDAYLKTYSWQLAFNRSLQLETFSLTCLNAERTHYPPTADLPTYVQNLLRPQTRAVPAHLLLLVDAGYGRRRKIRVDAFEEAETLAAFRQLHAARPDAPLTLFVETDERVSQARFFVKNDQQQVPLPHAKVVVYDAD